MSISFSDTIVESEITGESVLLEEQHTTLQKREKYDFDYDGVRKLYFKGLENHYKLPAHSSSKLWNKSLLHSKILELIFYAHSSLPYKIITVEGEDWLMYKTSDYNPIRILPVEEYFEIMAEAHIKTDHGGVEQMKGYLKGKYECPTLCMKLLLNCCNVCNNLHTSTKEDIAVWYFMVLPVGKPTIFKFVFILIEIKSLYTLLRPLISKDPKEISLELFKIFSTFGLPSKLVTKNHLFQIALLAVEQLKNMGSWFTFPVDTLPHKLCPNTNTIVAEINKWTNETGCDRWELGCRVLQWKMNTTLKLLPFYTTPNSPVNGIPYHVFIGKSRNVFNEINCSEVANKHGRIKGIEFELLETGARLPKNSRFVASLEANAYESTMFDTKKIYSTCNKCKELLVIQYKCIQCQKPLHSSCGIIKKTQTNTYTLQCDSSCECSAIVVL